MFLEDKLELMLKDSAYEDTATDMLNACIAHIADCCEDGMKAKDCAAVIKQTDDVWRRLCKKNGLGETAQNFFKKHYIDERCIDHPSLGAYFK